MTGNERLTDRGRTRLLEGLRLGDPYDEVLGGWLAREQVRDIYLTDSFPLAAVLLDRVIAACVADKVAEIRTLGKTLAKWRTEILNHHLTGASNGPTEGMILWSGLDGVVHVVDEAGEVRRGRVVWSASPVFMMCSC